MCILVFPKHTCMDLNNFCFFLKFKLIIVHINESFSTSRDKEKKMELYSCDYWAIITNSIFVTFNQSWGRGRGVNGGFKRNMCLNNFCDQLVLWLIVCAKHSLIDICNLNSNIFQMAVKCIYPNILEAKYLPRENVIKLDYEMLRLSD